MATETSLLCHTYHFMKCTNITYTPFMPFVLTYVRTYQYLVNIAHLIIIPIPIVTSRTEEGHQIHPFILIVRASYSKKKQKKNRIY